MSRRFADCLAKKSDDARPQLAGSLESDVSFINSFNYEVRKRKEMIGKSLKSAAALLVFCGMSSSAYCGTVLTVDIADLSAVAISATGEASEVNDTSSVLLDGVTLIDLFSSDFPIFTVASATTLASPTTLPYTIAEDVIGAVTTTDLNLLGFFNTLDDFVTQEFSTSAPAFSGEFVADFTGAPIALGTVGDVIVGDRTSGSGAVIGQFEVIDSSIAPVPEPASMALFAVGCLAGIGILRRKGNLESN